MKIITFLIIALVFTNIQLLHAQNYVIKSIDENTVVTINTNNNLSWSLTYKNETVIEDVQISMTINNKLILGDNPKVIKKSTGKESREIFPVVPNKDSKIKDEYNQITLQFETDFSLIFRVYNDGVAYQFVTDLDGQIEVNSETMNIRFSEKTTSYFPLEEVMYSHYERTYILSRLDTIDNDEFCSLPVMFNTGEKVKILFSEAALHDYPNMFLEGNNDNSLHSIFPNYVLETKPKAGFRADRIEVISKEADYIAKTTGKRSFPWRVFIVSDDDRTFVESNLIFQLSVPCKLENTDWIKPGKVAWDWYNANNIYEVDFESGINTETYKYYIDFASEFGIEYVILDEGWTKSTTEILDTNPDIDLPEIIRYAKSKNVEIILWVLWLPLDNNMDEILKKYSDWGVKGIKVDFMQRADQYMVNSYERIAKEAAKYQLLVDFHGAFKPAGLRKAYPNVISYEGVKGNEHNKWSADITPEHTVTIPFIRMVAGPMDFTPGAMRNASQENFNICFNRPMSIGTRCHQVAMYVIYESPLQMMCETPSTYYKEKETTSFISKIPTVWDETVVLEGSISDYIVIARRKGDNWYLGAMTDSNAREFTIDFSFLENSEYNIEIMKDGINADKYAEDYKKEVLTINQKTKLGIKLASGGGWAAIVTKKKE